MKEEPLRLGGMALRNGLLIHGPGHWAAAVRTRDGAIASASGPKPRFTQVDGRVPPGLGEDVARRRIEEVLGAGEYRIEFREQVVGNGSPVDTPLMEVIRDWVGEREPEATVVPTILPGYTDSRTWRDVFPGCVAYGFFPHAHQTSRETTPLIHSANERIDVRDLELATDFFGYAARRVLG